MDDQNDEPPHGQAKEAGRGPGDALVEHILEHGTDAQRAALHELADVLAVDLIKRQAAERRQLRARLRDA